MELIVGIVPVVLGIFVIIRMDVVLIRVVMLYGPIAAITGISDIVLYVKTERYVDSAPAITLISGIFSVMAGIILLIYPNAGKWIIALLFPIWSITRCISRLSHLHVVHITVEGFYHYVTLTVDILGLVLGCVMVIWPGISLSAVGVLIGGYLILAGIGSIVMAVSNISCWLVETELTINIP